VSADAGVGGDVGPRPGERRGGTKVSSTIVDSSPDLTELLRRASAGDGAAAGAAYEAVYGELRRIARRLMRNEPVHHTLDAEGLLHEAYLKVANAGAKDWADRGHFLAVMSRAMRQHLVDYARHKGSVKGGGGQHRVPLTGIVLKFEMRAVDLMTLDEALSKLDAAYPETAQVVELTFFVGLNADEVAAAVGSSARTVVRELKFARTFLEAEFDK
jgi:RNA polymerase sigma factor (TIGR02999 family)